MKTLLHTQPSTLGVCHYSNYFVYTNLIFHCALLPHSRGRCEKLLAFLEAHDKTHTHTRRTTQDSHLSSDPQLDGECKISEVFFYFLCTRCMTKETHLIWHECLMHLGNHTLRLLSSHSFIQYVFYLLNM